MPIPVGDGHPEMLRIGEGPDRPVRRRPPPDPDLRHSAVGAADHVGPVHRAAQEHHRAAGAVRGPGQGGDRARLAQRLHRAADRLPRAAHRLDRHRAELDRSHHADRGPAAAEPEARRRAAEPAGRVAADQRAARAEGAAARRAQHRGRAQEPGDRAGPPRGGREGDRAGADLALQVGVPGQHEPRAAHAAQLDPDPGPAARRQSRRQPQGQAGRVRPHHPRRRHRPPEPDLRHPRPVQDRIGHRHRRCRGDLLHQRAGDGGAAVPPPGRVAGPPLRRPGRGQPGAQPGHRLQAPAADPQEPAVERAEVHRPGQRAAARAAGEERLAPGQHGAQPGELGGGLRGHRHRRRHPGREAEDRVRGLPAGRRLDQPQVRRHGPRPRHQPRAGAAAGRRAHLAQHAGHGLDLHALPADHVHRPAHGGAPARSRRRAGAAGRPAGASRRPVPRRPPQPAAGRADAADRRGRSRTMPASWSMPRMPPASRRWSPRAARRRSTSRWNTSRSPCRSTSSCPTCWAGTCSASSSARSRRATSRCRS